jgi:hypothetical protein
MDAASVSEEMDQTRLAFRELVQRSSPDDLRRQSAGTRWTNRQLLFHMVFGYLVVRTLLPLVRGFGRLPLSYSRRFAAVLHAVRRPYHLVNYVGSCAGGAFLTPRAVAALLDRTVVALQRTLAGEDERSLGLQMTFPTSWDPYFTDTMTVLEVYHFATQHFTHHQHQLTL